MKVWLNGSLVEEGEAYISPADHGLLVGDGVYGTLRCYSGKPYALRDHLERLERGAHVLGIQVPPAEQLGQAVSELIADRGVSDARLRITVTSGAGPPGLARGPGPSTVLVTAAPFEPWPPTASAVVSHWRRDEQSPLAGVKTTSIAESVVALIEARAEGADEALLLDSAGNLCEGTTTNVFLVREGCAETPSLACGCLAGITRDRVMRLCGQVGIEAREGELPATALASADELFLTSSTREVQPLVRLNGEPVGDGAAGPVTARLREAFSDMVRRELGL